MRILLLSLLALSGCHRACGSWVPVWVSVDCARPDSAPDTGFGVPDTFDTSGEDTGAGCDVALSLTANGAASATVTQGNDVTFVATADNLTDQDVTLHLIDPCPSGNAVFTGLSPSYDFYDTCVAGACETTGQPVELVIPAGSSYTVSTTIDTGDGTCNDAVAPGTYAIGASFPLSTDAQPTICAAEPIVLTVDPVAE